MLSDLNELAKKAKEKCNKYDQKEFIFSDAFKAKFNELLPDYGIEFHKYTSVVKTKGNNLLIIVPNQWFVIGSFFSDYIEALRKYKSVSEALKITDAEIKAFRDEKIIDEKTKTEINLYLAEPQDASNFKKFLTDYSWWFGSKTIDRGDYFVSPVLNLAGVVNVTQAYIADLAWILSTHKDLIEIFEADYSCSIKLLSSNLVKTENTIFYGSPGTGKSHRVNEILKPLDAKFFERITFHPEYDNASFVGGYKPISERNAAGIDEVKYKFVPQVFTDIYVAAWKDLHNQHYLVIEEINRGNCAEIFGDIFQLLDRNSNYTVTPSSVLKEFIVATLGVGHDGIKEGLKLPPNLSILATMNTSDQSLFPMDSAFKRRWDWEYIPICYIDKTDEGVINESFNFYVKLDDKTKFGWIDFIKAVNHKIKHVDNLGMDKCIGNYFIKPEKSEISLKEFINKAIFYLWNDVFKDEDEVDSIFRKGVFYEDFFPIQKNGMKLVNEIITSLAIEVKPLEVIVGAEVALEPEVIALPELIGEKGVEETT
jgi:hypothetical protein